jgi:CheY-like chemotaxis protein
MRPVMVVEDDDDIRMTLRFLLESAGYAVTEAADGVAALDLLHAQLVANVVLLDMLMPRLSGMEVLRAIAAQPTLAQMHRIILLTARAQSFPPDDALLLDRLNVPVMRKPFEIDELLDAVHAAQQQA